MASVSYPIAFLAGIVSFLSPCVLPLVPGYLAFISGVGVQNLLEEQNPARRAAKILPPSISFVVGFSLVFILLGASATAIGAWLRTYQQLFTWISGIVVIVLGLFVMGVFRIPTLMREFRFHAFGKSGILGSFLAGLAFAFGWTPCVGPILAVILTLAASEQSAVHGALLLGTYSLGLGIPFVLTGLALNSFMGVFNMFKKYLRVVEIASGALLVAVGVLIFTGQLAMVSAQLAFFNPEALLAPSGSPLAALRVGPPPQPTTTPPLAIAAPPSRSLRGGTRLSAFRNKYDFAVEDLNGQKVSLSDFSGKYILLNFWAPWCPPCRAEMPGFERVYRKYRDRGLVIWGVGIKTTVGDIKDFAKKIGVTYPLALDRSDQVASKYQVHAIPSSFLFGPDGKLLKMFIGFTDERELEKIIQEAIR